VGKKKSEQITDIQRIDESSLFARISKIIEKRKSRAGMYANREVTLMYWEIGHHIRSTVLDGERAEYGKRVVVTLSQQLVKKYGSAFELRNLRRMVQFAELFPELKIVSPLATQLSWSHFIEILPLESQEARLFYANDAAARHLGRMELRKQISRNINSRNNPVNLVRRWEHGEHIFRQVIVIRVCCYADGFICCFQGIFDSCAFFAFADDNAYRRIFVRQFHCIVKRG